MVRRIVVAILCWSVLQAGMNVNAQPVTVAPVSAATQETPVSTSSTRPELLTPEEDESLTARSEEPGREVVGGALTNQQITYILIALATAVVVLVLK